MMNTSSLIDHIIPLEDNDDDLLFQRISITPRTSQSKEFSLFSRSPLNEMPEKVKEPQKYSPLLQIHPSAPIIFRRGRTVTDDMDLCDQPKEDSREDCDAESMGPTPPSIIQIPSVSPSRTVYSLDEMEDIELPLFSPSRSFSSISSLTEMEDFEPMLVTPPSSPNKAISKDIPKHHRVRPMIGSLKYDHLLECYDNQQRRKRNFALTSSEFEPILDALPCL